MTVSTKKFKSIRVDVNPVSRYVRVSLPTLVSVRFPYFSLRVEGVEILSGRSIRNFSFARPQRIVFSAPIRGFRLSEHNISVTLRSRDKSITFHPKIRWVISGKFRYVSAFQRHTFRWRLSDEFDYRLPLESTPWESILISKTSKKRPKYVSRGFELRRENFMSATGIQPGSPLLILGNSPSVDPSILNCKPPQFRTIAFNRFRASYPLHNIKENLLVSADPKMIENHRWEMQPQAENGSVLIDSSLRLNKDSTLPFRRSFIERKLFRSDLSKSIQTFSSSPMVGIQLGLSLEPPTIAIYGVDMTFSSVEPQSTHGRGMTTGDSQHFIHNYRKGLPWYPPKWDNILDGWFIFSIIAHDLNIRLLNLSPASHVPIWASPIDGMEDLP